MRSMFVSFALAVAVGSAAALALFRPATAAGQSRLGAQRVAFGLEAPTFAAAPDGDPRLFITQRAGKIVVLTNGGVSATPFLDIDAKVDDEGEGGLLGLAFPPDYAESGFFYVYYTTGDPGVPGDLVAVVARYRAMGDPATSAVADPSSEAIVFSVAKPTPEHNGGTIAIRAGFLYLALGDGGGVGDPDDLAQDDASPFGKILRFDLAQPPPIPPALWAKGFRNPFRFSFDRATGDLYVGDVGQDAVEEIDVEPASSLGGRNYGWDVMEGGDTCFDSTPEAGEPPCFDPSLVAPVHEYPHDALEPCNAVTGGVVYRGSALPQLVGQYLFGDFCTERIFSFTWDGAGGTVGPVVDRTHTIFPDVSGIDAISAFAEDSAGEVYVVDLGGEVFKLVPEPSSALAGAGALAALAALRKRRPACV
jgi:glucose/arabinose dehydrogenase